MIFGTPRYAIQSLIYAERLGWNAARLVNSVSSASNIIEIAPTRQQLARRGAISIQFLKVRPTPPRWACDPGMKLYRSIMKKYNRAGTSNDVYHVYAMASAHSFVEALRKRAGIRARGRMPSSRSWTRRTPS